MKPSKNVKPLALPRKPRDKPAEGSRCSTAGWGITHQRGQLAKSLQELDLRLLDTRMCNNSRFWNGVLTDSMLCLKAGAKGQAPCKVTGVAWNQPLTPWGVEEGGTNTHLISQIRKPRPQRVLKKKKKKKRSLGWKSGSQKILV